MREIIIECENLSPAQLHGKIGEALAFPSWYGANLDALYDCLTDLEEDTHLICRQLHDAAFRATLLEASLASRKLTVTLE